MATRRTKSVGVLRYSEGFRAGLSSAVLEWLLIFLLFVNAVFSYFVTKFARFCELKVPCILCSRLDHVLGNEKPGFYKDLICGAHRLEISSLIFCHVHDKLADVHGMCEGCLFSFAAAKKSNSETYRLLVGKLGIDHDFLVDKDPLLLHRTVDSPYEMHCSCCNELWKTRPYAHNRLFPKKSIGPEVGKIDFRLSVGHSGLDIFDGLKKRRAHMVGRGFDPLSYVGYSELKLTSDSESEVPLSDDDDASSLIRETNNLKEEFVGQSEPYAIVSDNLVNGSDEVLPPSELINQASTPAPSLLDPNHQHDVSEPHHMSSPASPIDVGHGLEELNWHQVEQNPHLPALSDLISLHDVSSLSNVPVVVVDVSRGTWGGDLEGTSKREKEGVCKSDTYLTPATVRGPGKDQVVEAAGETFDILRSVHVGKVSLAESGEASTSDSVSTTITGPGSKVNEELKVLLAQISVTRGSDTPVNDTSPRVHEFPEDLKILHSLSSTGLDTFQKRILIERNESGFESLDGSVISEIEGENLADRLKRQVEYDRKCIFALYKELDEERNASTVAANQAMAMITRLQEEKAALHMEALQYLRMMEEQAEYDVEALQKANDLLAEREKEIQDLEADLDYYRIKYPDEETEENIPESCEVKVANMTVEHDDLGCNVNNANGACDLLSITKSDDNVIPKHTDAIPTDNHMSTIKDSLLNYEDERLFISQSLKKLEKKLNLFSGNGALTGMCNGVYSKKEKHKLNDMEEDCCNVVIKGRDQIDEDKSSVQNHHFVQPEVITSKTIDLVSIENEVLDLNERLETLEADKDFIEHTISSLQNGDEGVKFIKEIAHHLQELRRIGIRRREKDVA